MAQSMDGKEQSELACRYVRMLFPWRKKEKENSCVENVSKKEASAPANTAKPKSGLASGGNADRRDPRYSAAVADMPKSEAEAHMAVILKPLNEDAAAQKPVYTFGGYLEEVFLPTVQAEMEGVHANDD